MTDRDLTYAIRGAAFEVHGTLGSGLLEGAYQAALLHKLRLCGLNAEAEVGATATYKGMNLGVAYRLDIVVENRVVLELKALPTLHPVHESQLLTYLRFSGIHLGYLINFGAASLDDNNLIRRVLT